MELPSLATGALLLIWRACGKFASYQYNLFPSVDMSLFRTSLVTLAIVQAWGLLVTWKNAEATPIVSAHVVSVDRAERELVHVTLRTQEGLERFLFRAKESPTTESEEVHYAGFARPRNFQREKLPASLTMTSDKAWLFFTSRRTGRPAAAIITLSRADTKILAERIRVSRVPQKTLECGSHAGEEETTPTVGISRARRVNRSLTDTTRVSTRKAFSPARVLEVATEADYEFSQLHGTSTNSYIRAVLNAVDVIYSSSLGIRIKLVGQRTQVSPSGSSRTVQALDLLEEFRRGDFASNSPADVRHLFTGRSIQGLTIGIAYVAATCTANGIYGVGLSRDVSEGLQPFLAAHEIAHNLSATHDGEARSIMNPAITQENNRFTTKAITSIQDFVSTTGTCLATESLSTAKLSLDPTDPSRFRARVSFTSSLPASCSVTLYGSQNARNYVALASRAMPGVKAGVRSGLTFSADAPPLSTAQTFHFKVQVTCGEVRTISAPSRLRFGVATSESTGSPTPGRWLQLLKANLKTP